MHRAERTTHTNPPGRRGHRFFLRVKKGRRKSIFWTAAKVRCRSPFPTGGALALESPQLYVRTSMISTGKETIAQQVFSGQRTRRLPVPRWVDQGAPVSCHTRGYSDSFPGEVLSGALLECRNVCSVPLRRRYIGEEDLTHGLTYYKDTFPKRVAKWTIRCFSNASPSSSVSAVREANRMPSSAAEMSRKKGAPSKSGLSSIAQTQKPAGEATSSVYLRLCAAEQRLKVSQAIAATQAAWKQKARLKDWRAGQKGAFYDGPAWFKFWLKKKRPGARG